MLRIAIAVSLALTLTTLSACNTVKGLGEDIQSVGQAGDDAL